MTSVTFGRYVPYNSFVHRLDPRSKFLFLIMLMVVVFMPFNVWSTSLIFSLTYLIIFLIIMAISHVSFLQLLKSLKAMWFLVIFLMIVYILIPNPNYTMPAFDINGYVIYWDGFYQSAYIILRLILMISITMVLTASTKPLDLTYALEWYMTPLKVVRFPVHIIAMMISIALRFIPTILDETQRIMKAQESRGVDFSHGGLIKRIKAIISLIIPLFASAFERSDQLADAMEARGYDPYAKRTRFQQLHFHWSDLIAFIIVTGFMSGIIYLSVCHKDLNLIETIFHVEVPF